MEEDKKKLRIKNMQRKELIDHLIIDYHIKGSKRFVYSANQSWYLTKFERLAARKIETYLRPLKSTIITDIYGIAELKKIWPKSETRQYAVKYILVFMKSMNMIKVKCNNGYKILAWNRERERRIKKSKSLMH